MGYYTFLEEKASTYRVAMVRMWNTTEKLNLCTDWTWGDDFVSLSYRLARKHHGTKRRKHDKVLD
jgi:hypothetical protein